MLRQFEIPILKIFHRENGMVVIDKDPLSDDDNEERRLTEQQFEKLTMLMPQTMWIEIVLPNEDEVEDLNFKI